MISVVCGRTVTKAEIFTVAFQFLLKMNRYWTWSQAPSPALTHPRHTEQCHPSLWQHRAPPGSEVRGSMIPGSKNSSWMIWTVTLTGTERALRKSCKRTPYVGNLSCRSLHTSAFSQLRGWARGSLWASSPWPCPTLATRQEDGEAKLFSKLYEQPAQCEGHWEMLNGTASAPLRRKEEFSFPQAAKEQLPKALNWKTFSIVLEEGSVKTIGSYANHERSWFN